MKIYDDHWDGGRMPLDVTDVKERIAKGYDFALVGKRVKERRLQLSLSAQELASRARISRQTLARFEAGEPFKESTLRKIQFVLGLFTSDLKDESEGNDFAKLHSAGDTRWLAAYPRSRYLKSEEAGERSNINDPQERERLGSTGLQPFFSSQFNNHLQNGTLRNPGLMEIHQPSWFDQHPGEECVYCLKGTLRMIVRDEEFVLTPGSCLVFKAFERHKYIPESEDGSPVLIFLVLALSKEDAQRGLRTWPSDEEIERAQTSGP